MSQVVFDTIDPTNTSGTELASILNNFKNAVMSGLIGTTRPDQVTAGGFWIDSSLQVSDSKWRLRLWTGTAEITMLEINLATNSISVPGSDSSFAITRVSEDAIGATLRLIKKRVSASQVLTGDTLGSASFYGYTASSIETLSARFRAEAIEDFTSGALGTDLVLETTKAGENTPSEHLRATNGKVTIGSPNITAVETLEVGGSIVARRSAGDALPSRLISVKKRTSGGGQTLNNDEVSQFLARGYDDLGNEIDLMKMTVKAIQNITSTVQGTRVSFEKKDTGGIVFIEKMAITDDGVEAANLTLLGSLRNSSATDITVGADVDLPNPHKGIILLTGALTSIRGITLPLAGEEFRLVNLTGGTVTIKNNVAGAGANKILTGTNDDLEMEDGSSLQVFRDGTNSVYRISGGSGAGGGGKKFQGTWAAPVDIASTTFAFTGSQGTLVVFSKGDTPAGTTTLAGSPKISAGTKIGQELWFVSTSSTDLYAMSNGDGILTKGDFLSDIGSIIKFMWTGVAWLEIGRE